MSRERFDRYVQEGRKAVELHADFGQITDDEAQDFLSCASDMIASILHASDTFGSVGGYSPTVVAEALHARAWRAYLGDFDEIKEGTL